MYNSIRPAVILNESFKPFHALDSIVSPLFYTTSTSLALFTYDNKALENYEDRIINNMC